jgi:hypothetical protein
MRWSERRTAVRPTFEMISTFPLRVTRGLVRRRSSCSRWMVKHVVRWTAVLLLAFLASIAGFLAYSYVNPVPFHEFDFGWYHTGRGVTEAGGRSFQRQHRCAVLRAQADHFVHPFGPGRIIVLFGASSPNESGDVFLYFVSAFVSSSAASHLLPVYCWSEREGRLVWKGLQDNSP